MGWETAISLGANALSAFNTTNNAKAQTGAIAATAENQAANLANKTSRTEGSLETSFIKGGIALTGAGGPAAVFGQAAAQGSTDIQRTIDNANSSIANTMNEARTKALTTIAGGVSKIGAGTIQNGLTSAWNGIMGNPDPSPQGILDTSPVSDFSTASMGGNTSFGTGLNWGK